MTLNDAYQIYLVLHKRLHQQDQNVSRLLKPLTMDGGVEILYWLLLQKSEDVQKYTLYHPSLGKNFKFVINTNGGNRVRSDSNNKHDEAGHTPHYSSNRNNTNQRSSTTN